MKLTLLIVSTFTFAFFVNHECYGQFFFHGNTQDAKYFAKSMEAKITKEFVDTDGRKYLLAEYPTDKNSKPVYSMYVFGKSGKIVEGNLIFDKSSEEAIRMLKTTVGTISKSSIKIDTYEWKMSLVKKENVFVHLNVNVTDCNCYELTWRVDYDF